MTSTYSPRIPGRAASLCLAAVLVAAACQEPAPRDPKRGILTEAPDSLATAREIRASLAGEAAPGADAYSFRGFYAGMTRRDVDQRVPNATATPDSAQCHSTVKVPAELLCGYAMIAATDHAHLQVDIVYAAAGEDGQRVAREITITRLLPLNVDGVQVAGALADAFEQQTTLLDSRDATYDRHQAHIRMGTLKGTRAHYAEVNVVSHAGREELTVKLGRGAGR